MLKNDSDPTEGTRAKRRPWFEEIQRLKQLEKESQGLVQKVGDRRSRVYAFVVAYKRVHDGCSPSLTVIAEGCGLPTAKCASQLIDKLVYEGKFTRPAHKYSKVLQVVGGSWTIPGIENIIKGLQ